MCKKSSKRLLIFIVAYNAKNTLYNVLKRIPESIYQYDYQILIIDDSSKDETFKLGLEYKHRHPELNIEILYNPEHQGYGGNQKLGYEYAIRCGFDVIVLLHGDGKYAPEILIFEQQEKGRNQPTSTLINAFRRDFHRVRSETNHLPNLPKVYLR